MALAVVEAESRHDGTEGVIVVESDLKAFNIAITELQAQPARTLALKFAGSKGLADPRVKGSLSTYPVDADGKPVTDPKGQTTFRYRVDIPVVRRLV